MVIISLFVSANVFVSTDYLIHSPMILCFLIEISAAINKSVNIYKNNLYWFLFTYKYYQLLIILNHFLGFPDVGRKII